MCSVCWTKLELIKHSYLGLGWCKLGAGQPIQMYYASIENVIRGLNRTSLTPLMLRLRSSKKDKDAKISEKHLNPVMLVFIG